MIAAAWTGSASPWELTEALLCEKFNKLPSEIKDEPADDILRMMALLNIYYSHYNAKAHEGRGPSALMNDD